MVVRALILFQSYYQCTKAKQELNFILSVVRGSLSLSLSLSLYLSIYLSINLSISFSLPLSLPLCQRKTTWETSDCLVSVVSECVPPSKPFIFGIFSPHKAKKGLLTSRSWSNWRPSRKMWVEWHLLTLCALCKAYKLTWTGKKETRILRKRWPSCGLSIHVPLKSASKRRRKRKDFQGGGGGGRRKKRFSRWGGGEKHVHKGDGVLLKWPGDILEPAWA